MTFSIIARCPKTRRLGLGIATFSIAAGGMTVQGTDQRAVDLQHRLRHGLLNA